MRIRIAIIGLLISSFFPPAGAQEALRIDNNTGKIILPLSGKLDGTTTGLTLIGFGGGTGTVTSIGVTVPAFLSVSPASITTSGTFALTLSGTALPIANGGTGLTAIPGTTGQLLYNNAGAIAAEDPVVSQPTASLLNAQVVGNVASGATDSGNPIEVGGAFNTTQPTVTNGQRVIAQFSARGEQLIAKGVSGFSIDNTAFIANAGTNLNTSALALEAGGNLATIAAKDFATQTTLALIKAKTDNLDVLLSTRTKPADTQTVSGTVTANAGTNLNTSLLALEAGGNLAALKLDADNLALAQASTTAGQKGNLIFGATTTSAPVYTTAQSNPLSLTIAGALRVDGSNVTQPVSGTFWQATQPVSIGDGIDVTLGAKADAKSTATDTTAVSIMSVLKEISAMEQAPASRAVTNAGTFLTQSVQSGNWTMRLQGNAGAIIDFAGQNAVAPANSILIGGEFNTTPTTITSGNASPLQLDASGNLLVNVKAGSTGNAAASATGSAVPASGDYQGLNVGGTLRGWTGLNPSGVIYTGQIDETTINGVVPLMGNGVTGTGSQRVTIASDNTAFTVNSAESGTWNIRLQDTAGNGLTSNSTTYTAKFGLDENLLGTLGTAFTTPGKIDVKLADGDQATLGLKADAKSTATDTTAVSIMQVLKQISASVQAPPSQAVTNAGTFAVQDAQGAAAAGTAGWPTTLGNIARSTASWTSATSLDTALTMTTTNYGMVVVTMNSTSTITQGTLNFEASDDAGTTWFVLPADQNNNFTINATYVIPATTKQSWSVPVAGFTNFRVRLNPVITGTGTVTIGMIGSSAATEPAVTVGQSTASQLQATARMNDGAGNSITSTSSALDVNVKTNAATNQSVNVAQINGVAPLMGNGVTGTGSQRVTIASDNTANSNPFLITQVPAATGGLSTFHLVSAATTNATNIKASAGQVFGWFIYNSNAAARKVAFHNTAGTPTAGSSIFFTLVIPPSSGANVEFNSGLAFSTGIAITTVTGLTDADATAVALNDLIINVFYK